jgi:two-component system sensor histidine kinase RegB
MQLELGLCYLAVGVSVIGNLIAIFIFPENKRLSESQNFLMIFFDLLQLGFLLFLTGGLNNPFALLMLGPVTISAAILELLSFVVISFSAILIVSALLGYYFPLRTADGTEMQVPDILMFGHWTALVIAVLFLGLYSRRLSIEMHSMSDALTATQMALAREQKLTDLGGVVAAAAHELGTPLATIKLASSELIEELEGNRSLQEDAELIREQTDRCRDILRDMGRAGKDDLHLRRAPLSAVIQEAAQPHEERGKQLHYKIGRDDQDEADQPSIFRKPEIIHGLRNLVQNAVDFAQANVWIEANWSSDAINLRIVDDGPGFPASVIGRIGDPFMSGTRRQKPSQSERPAYEGMGLGLFIAKTLLERSGAELTFINGGDGLEPNQQRLGAIVDLTWPREIVDARQRNMPNGLGQNEQIRV